MRRHPVSAACAALASAAVIVGSAGAASAQIGGPASVEWGSAHLPAIVGSVGTLSAGSPIEEPPAVNPPVGPYEKTGFLTPDRPEFWNPMVSADRLVSPFGTSTRIRCTSFHGVTLQCWQDDRDGRPHRLVELALNYPGSTGSGMPGGGPGTYVYADPAGWTAGS